MKVVNRIELLLLSAVCSVALAGCVGTLDQPDACQPTFDLLQHLRVDDVRMPTPLVVGSTLIVEGESFIDAPLCVSSTVTLQQRSTSPVEGSSADELDLDFEVTSPNSLRAIVPESLNDALNDGDVFQGQLVVNYQFFDDGRRISASRELSFRFARRLEPEVHRVLADEAFLNDQIELEGEGFLDGDSEGETLIIVNGTFDGDDGTVVDVANIEIPAVASVAKPRSRLQFPWSPRISGIRPGRFRGSLTVRNSHAHGQGGVVSGSTTPITMEQQESVLFDLTPGVVSLGQIVEARGRGFIGGSDDADDEGTTSIRLQGLFTPCTGGPRSVCADESYPAELEVVTEYLSGARARYGITFTNQGGVLQAIDFGEQRGVFVGSARPVLTHGTDRFLGLGVPDLTLTLGPIRQVVWVRFTAGFSDSLELFGLGAVADEIRRRVIARMQDIYCPRDDREACINVEIRGEEPEDYLRGAYAIVDIGGSDPNSLGLFGYDNSPNKDVGNLRLHDHIGGDNALGAQDGFGFGGVFVESLLFFSEHPQIGPRPAGAPPAEPLFDQVFAPVRYDEVVAGEWPEGADQRRLDEIELGIYALSNIIADTAAHELGHSLGLAAPEFPDGVYHNIVPADGCLMDAGSDRPLEERARLNGNQGAGFCEESLAYLRDILPLE